MEIFSDLLQKYSKNFKIAHLNINSIAGFKLHEIKSWLPRGFPSILKNTVLSPPLAKVMGWDNIAIRIIKDGVDFIAGPLSNLFNYSIFTNTIPKYWKFGQITPVFEKGSEYSDTNYRLITVPVAFNNVFERILVNKLYSYVSNKLSPFL